MRMKLLPLLTTFALLLALCVVMLGAYTRLTDAGLGCPDWPGCYGHLVLPKTNLDKVQANYPSIPLETRKAWTEMVHRYAAGFLGLLIIVIAFLTFKPSRARKMPWQIPLLLLAVLVFQALLGMWTVTLQLLPLVVMGHLLGGMVLVVLLCYFRLQLWGKGRLYQPYLRIWIFLAAVIVFLQIALGGWVSSNYAGLACIGFPQCNGIWWPSLHWQQAFSFSAIGANYQGGLLNSDARITMQFVHRMGAFITFSYIFLLCIGLLRFTTHKLLRFWAGMALFLVCLQFLLGVVNVVFLLPLPVAVLHNGVALLLLASVAAMLYATGGNHATKA
jgi:cytochrome c oxidase assembly protein subunit 15